MGAFGSFSSESQVIVLIFPFMDVFCYLLLSIKLLVFFRDLYLDFPSYAHNDNDLKYVYTTKEKVVSK